MVRFDVLALVAGLTVALAGGVAAQGTQAAPLNREEVVAAVKARTPEVSACYQKALTTAPWLAGRLVVNFTVTVEGMVARAEIERTELPDGRFLGCVQGVFKAWRFPTGPAPIELSYPFVFGATGSRDPSVLVDGRPRPAVLPARCTQARECRELGLGLAGGGEADAARAFGYLDTGCKLNDAASCAGAAAALDFGRGVAKDKKRAFATYQRACARSDQNACTAVAMTHALGLEGVAKRDPAKGVALLERACTAGAPAACLNLAERLSATDAARAAKVRERALTQRP
jgi:TPR repeat protein